MGIALILSLRFHRYTAWALLALFVVQFPITSTQGRLILCGVYAGLAVAGLVVNRGHLWPRCAHRSSGKSHPRTCRPTLRSWSRSAGRDGQCPVSNSMGSVIGPLKPVSGFHGAGPERRALGMRRVITVSASTSSALARCDPRQ